MKYTLIEIIKFKEWYEKDFGYKISDEEASAGIDKMLDVMEKVFGYKHQQ